MIGVLRASMDASAVGLITLNIDLRLNLAWLSDRGYYPFGHALSGDGKISGAAENVLNHHNRIIARLF